MNISGIDISWVSLITFAGTLVIYPKAFYNKITIVGGIYLAILFIYYLLGKKLPSMGAGENSELTRLIIASAFILPNLAIFNVLQYLQSDKIYRYITWLSLFVIILSYISFTPLIINNNEILRQTTYAKSENFLNPFLPHYSLLHAYILIIPATLMAYKQLNDKRRWVFLFVSIYTLYVIAMSSIATTIVLSVVLVVFMIMYSEQSGNNSLFRALFVSSLLFVLFQLGVVENIMDMVVDFYKGSASGGKMRLFRNILTGQEIAGGNSLESRYRLHAISVYAFFSNPLIGSDVTGGHSCLLDRLGGLGLVGFIPYVYFIYSIFKFALSHFSLVSSRTAFYIVAACAFLMLYEKGIFGQECWLFLLVLAPSILHYLESLLYTKN